MQMVKYFKSMKDTQEKVSQTPPSSDSPVPSLGQTLLSQSYAAATDSNMLPG